MTPLHKKPRIHRIIKVWNENGVDCWLMPYDDFNRLYNGENVVQMTDGRVFASITFANNPIVVYRQPKEAKT